jgi:outer membrane lipoprotein carrier protein
VKLLSAVGLTALLAAASLLHAQGEGPAVALARRIDKRHLAMGDLTARFVQTYRSGLMQRQVTESGVVSIKRPGRMRWEYREPEKKLFVADGKTFYFYVPADRQVIVRKPGGERGIPALLLAGQGGILTEFTVAMEPAPSPGVQRLKLTPRREDPEVETVFLEVDGGDRVRGIEVLDPQGNQSRFVFEDIRENVGLRDGLFRFQIPQGVEVVTG